MAADLSRYDAWIRFLTALPRRVPALQVVVVNLRFAVEPLVKLLRIQYCPARFDFGLRYLRTDLPVGFAERVEALLPGPDLAARSRAAFAWQDEVLAQLT